MLLEDTSKPQKILFTGHRGSGKSTELAKLGQRLRSSFFIISYSIKDRLNLFDITYVDIVLSLGPELIRAATEKAAKVKPAVLSYILDFAKEITKDIEISTKTQGDIGTELNLYVVKLAIRRFATFAKNSMPPRPCSPARISVWFTESAHLEFLRDQDV